MSLASRRLYACAAQHALQKQASSACVIALRISPHWHACCAAGYHLGDVNTALSPLSADLGLSVASEARTCAALPCPCASPPRLPPLPLYDLASCLNKKRKTRFLALRSAILWSPLPRRQRRERPWVCAGQGAVVVSALLVGAIFGSLGAGPAADALGPRRALLLNNAFFAAGSLLGAATPGGYWGAIAGARPAWARQGAALTCWVRTCPAAPRGSPLPALLSPVSSCMQHAALPGTRRSDASPPWPRNSLSCTIESLSCTTREPELHD